MAAPKENEIDEKKIDDNAVAMGLMADDDMDIIAAQIEKKPLVSDKLKLDLLLKEFCDHKNYTRQMNVLISSNKHNYYRQMRRDGNCFYRAFLLGLFETIESTQDIQLLTKVSENVMTSLHRCLKYGYEPFTIEDFYYAFMDELQFYQRKLESGSDEYKATDKMGNSAIERMANSSHAQYLIFWARMLASLYMRENEKNFAPFIPSDKGGFQSWLRSDVEALKAEADHLQTVALSRAINVPITLYCLENIQKGGPQQVNTIENEKSKFDLLFRPGHYDVLYRNNHNGSNNNNDTIQSIASSSTDNNENDSKTNNDNDNKKEITMQDKSDNDNKSNVNINNDINMNNNNDK